MSIDGVLWTASPVKHYGYGAGRAHPSVQMGEVPGVQGSKGAPLHWR